MASELPQIPKRPSKGKEASASAPTRDDPESDDGFSDAGGSSDGDGDDDGEHRVVLGSPAVAELPSLDFLQSGNHDATEAQSDAAEPESHVQPAPVVPVIPKRPKKKSASPVSDEARAEPAEPAEAASPALGDGSPVIPKRPIKILEKGAIADEIPQVPARPSRKSSGEGETATGTAEVPAIPSRPLEVTPDTEGDVPLDMPEPERSVVAAMDRIDDAAAEQQEDQLMPDSIPPVDTPRDQVTHPEPVLAAVPEPEAEHEEKEMPLSASRAEPEAEVQNTSSKEQEEHNEPKAKPELTPELKNLEETKSIPAIPKRPASRPKKLAVDTGTPPEDASVATPVIQQIPDFMSPNSATNDILDIYSAESPEQPKSKPALTQQDSNSSVSSTSTTKKGPPPVKPKKPSSKILAFQQQLMTAQQQEAESKPRLPSHRPKPPSRSSTATSASSLESPVAAEPGVPEVPKTRPKKLSTAFTKNLTGLWGGVAMPGMVAPGQAPPAALAKPAEEENDEEPAKDLRKGRARGPRGRKLPSSAVEPIVKSESKFSIHIADAWELTFPKEELAPVVEEQERAGFQDAKEVLDDDMGSGDAVLGESGAEAEAVAEEVVVSKADDGQQSHSPAAELESPSGDTKQDVESGAASPDADDEPQSVANDVDVHAEAQTEAVEPEIVELEPTAEAETASSDKETQSKEQIQDKSGTAGDTAEVVADAHKGSGAIETAVAEPESTVESGVDDVAADVAADDTADDTAADPVPGDSSV